MKYAEAKRRCHVRAAIARELHPSEKFWNNHDVPMDNRVPDAWKDADDWFEYDPHEPGPWGKKNGRAQGGV